MLSPEYDIAQFGPEHGQQVLDLLSQLWGEERQANLAHFHWKYKANPYADRLLGIVALRGDRVVGFRGYMATEWRTGEGDPPVFASTPGDTCVHSDHRRQGLSVAMGRFAMEAYVDRYRFFLNLTAGGNSCPGYRRMGFEPLHDKTCLNRYGPIGLCRFLLFARRSGRPRVPLGSDGDLLFSDAARPEDMAAVIAAQPERPGRMTLHQDERFFRWRFANPQARYVFGYCVHGGELTGYVVLGVALNGRRAHVLDAADRDGHSIGIILTQLAEHFDVLSFYHFAADDRLSPVLRESGFQSRGLLAWLEQRIYGVFPILVRPVRAAASEHDWLVNGLDIRKRENWAMKGLCSDSV